MNVAEIEREAFGPSKTDRSALVVALMDTLKAPGSEITAGEIAERDEGLESGALVPNWSA